MNNKILITRSSMPLFEEYINEIHELWDTAWLTNNGRKLKEFKKNLSKYLNTDHISLFTNGHMALELTLQALNLKKGGEVITTPFTFASTTHAIVRNGLKPVFCDISIEDYNIDVNKIESLITDNTVAILPVHVYGNVCDMESIQKIADKYNLKVIYDAAHTFGEQINGESICNFGDASILSFHATKVFNTVEGGAVIYKNKKLCDELDGLKNFGIRSQIIIDGIGANAKMDEFRACMGICNLRHIDEEIEKRKKVYEAYIQRLKNIKGIKLCNHKKEIKYNYAYMPVVFDENILNINRDQISDALERENIFARKYFYPLVNEYECYRAKYDVSKTPIAKYISDRVLTLPIYSDLDIGYVDKICNIIKDNIKIKI